MVKEKELSVRGEERKGRSAGDSSEGRKKRSRWNGEEKKSEKLKKEGRCPNRLVQKKVHGRNPRGQGGVLSERTVGGMEVC